MTMRAKIYHPWGGVGVGAGGPRGTMGQFEKMAREAGTAMGNGIVDATRAVEQSVRKGRFAAEDAIDQTKLVIRRRPFQSLAVAFGGGVVVGGAILYAIWYGGRSE